MNTSVVPDDANLSRLLLAEDDRILGGLLVEVLTEAYRVEHALDGQQALHWGLTRPFDVLVIDRGLPAVEGLEVLQRLRAKGVWTPALVLTARGTVADRVEGLDKGAQDYLVKPFDIDELLARLRALVRRPLETATTVPVGRRRLEVAQRRVSGGPHDAVDLSGRETELLLVLARRPSQVFDRGQLLDLVFDGAEDPGLVDTYVYFLRRKLGRQAIRTVRGIGYQLGEA